MTKTALELASELRAEAIRLHREAAQLQEAAQILEGTHFSVPEELRPTEEERVARMTPAEARWTLRMAERWKKVRPDEQIVTERYLELLRARATA